MNLGDFGAKPCLLVLAAIVFFLVLSGCSYHLGKPSFSVGPSCGNLECEADENTGNCWADCGWCRVAVHSYLTEEFSPAQTVPQLSVPMDDAAGWKANDIININSESFIINCIAPAGTTGCNIVVSGGFEVSQYDTVVVDHLPSVTYGAYTPVVVYADAQGINYYAAGIALGPPDNNYTDFCDPDTNILTEGFCYSSYARGFQHLCEHGCADAYTCVCQAGETCTEITGYCAYVDPQTPDDPSKNRVLESGNAYTDNCSPDSPSDGKIYRCQNGEIKSIQGCCYDYDEGKDYYTESIDVFGFSSGNSPYLPPKDMWFRASEWCDGNNLWEYYCQNSKLELEIYNCSEGCSNGACIGAAITLATIKSTYSIGETVLLTDPPEAENKITGNVLFGGQRSVIIIASVLVLAVVLAIIFYKKRNTRAVCIFSVLAAVLAVMLLLALVPIQGGMPEGEQPSAPLAAPQEMALEQRWSDFEDKYGEAWEIEENPVTDVPHKVYGSSIDVNEEITAENIDTVSKDFITANKDLFKAAVDDLELVKVEFDKPLYPEHTQGVATITYKQKYGEIPVYKSLVSVTYINGKLATATTDYYPGIDVSPTPTITAGEALEIVKADLGIAEDAQAKNISLWIFPEELGDRINYHLTWKVEMPLLMQQEEPSQWVYFVDAHTGMIVYKYNDIIYDSLSGTVTGMIYPEHTAQDQIQAKFRHNIVNANGIFGVTDIDGNYEITGLTGSINIGSTLFGPYVEVVNDLKDEAQHTASVNVPTTHNWNWKDDDTSDRQEESNLFYHLNLVHDFFTRGDPFDIHEMDYPSVGTVQYGAGTYHCNAMSDGTNTYYYGASDSCENTALLSDIVYHEYTHSVTRHLIEDFPYWDETGNMNEGFSDYFSSSINNNPCVSEGFFIGQSCLRNIDNTARYPEDYNPEPHGIIFPGALWDLRKVLGQDLTDSLIIRTMKLQPHSFAEFIDFMLTIDDDNANLDDGTPHINEICHAFGDLHGLYSSGCAGYTENPLAIITSPEKNNIYGGSLELQIIGTAYGSKTNPLQYYIIEYANYNNLDLWSSEGVTLTGGEVINGILGELRIDNLQGGKYEIKLKVVDNGNNQVEVSTTILIDRDLESGWPQKSAGIIMSYPIIDNIDKSENYEIITGDDWGYVVVWRNDGSMFRSPNWGGCKIHGIAAGDIDNDGKDEIVSSSCTWISAWDYAGNILSGWPIDYFTLTGETIDASSPALGDIDNDGDLEIVVYVRERTSKKSKIYAWHHDGTLVDGWPQEMSINPLSYVLYIPVPVLGDIDNDGNLEIVVGSNEGEYLISTNGKVYAWHHDGTLVDGWPQETEPITFSSAALGDIDNDGNLEIIDKSDYGKVYAWHHDGTLVDGWPKICGSHLYTGASSPALGDIDNDGNLEIVVGGDYKLCVFNYNGNLIKDFYGQDVSLLTIGDIDDDREIEIIGRLWDSLYAWNLDGSVVDGWPKYATDQISGVALGDIDSDSNVEIIVTSFDKHVYVWDMKKKYDPITMEWPMFRHDAQNTGLYTKPLPKSMIRNEEAADINGYLHMEIQKNIDGRWQIQQVIVVSMPVTISAHSYMPLDTVWRDAGAYTATEAGQFRIYAELRDDNNRVILSSSYEFTVAT